MSGEKPGDREPRGGSGLRLAVMQPYFLPYVGYYQLIAAADLFIVYDNIEYTKKGWINRNRLLRDGKDVVFSLPLKRAPDHLDVCERELAADFDPRKLLDKISGAYRRAPYFPLAFPLIERIVTHADRNLFRFLHHAIVASCRHLGITTEIRVSSGIAIDHGLKSQDKVLALCEAVGAATYINASGGRGLYAKSSFEEKGIALKFLQSLPVEYPQFGAPFLPWLSIVDVLMFNAPAAFQPGILSRFELT